MIQPFWLMHFFGPKIGGLPLEKRVNLLVGALSGPKTHQSRCSGRGRRMAAVLPDPVPPWMATCFRGFLGGGFPGGVLFEQQLQIAAAIGDVGLRRRCARSVAPAAISMAATLDLHLLLQLLGRRCGRRSAKCTFLRQFRGRRWRQ